MNAEFKAGNNWHIRTNLSEGNLLPSGKSLHLENEVIRASVTVHALLDKVKIPAPVGIDPESAEGLGVTVSKLKDEEGGLPQEFLNLEYGGSWIHFFPNDQEDSLLITGKD